MRLQQSNGKLHSIRWKSLVCLSLLAVMFLPWVQTAQAFATTGTVYRDYNANGTQDSYEFGVPNVTVSAYDATGALIDAVQTNASGNYSLTIPTTDQIRVEFSGYTSYLSGPFGATSGTTVQFVAGNASNVNLGINKPSEYCQSNPTLAASCYKYSGDATTPGDPTAAALLSFPYTAGTTSRISNANVEVPTTHTLQRPESELGAVGGVAYQRSSQTIFAAAFMKRHVRFGPAGTGAIYRINAANPSSPATLFLDLNALFGANTAGSDLHDNADYYNDNDTIGWDAIGKVSFADLDISEDDQTLWTINLADRQLYRMPLVGNPPVAPLASQIGRFPMPNPGIGATGCPTANDLRPGGLKSANGVIYVGLVCSAESTNNPANLRGFVYAFDPNASTWTQVANFPLNYQRGWASYNWNGGSPIALTANWQPWSPTIRFHAESPFGVQRGYAQPWLTDIEFDERGNMILGFTDRLSHQTGNNQRGSGPVEGVSSGDILRLAPSGSTWVVENNGAGSLGAGNNQGPGGGEFFYEDRFPLETGPSHDQTMLGMLSLVLGTNQVVGTAFDTPPVQGPAGGFTSAYRSGGMIWTNLTNGQRERSYLIYGIEEPLSFGKASGLGDIEPLCLAAPLEIGNRVWYDPDGDGLQDPGEFPMGGIVLELYHNGVLVATATTDANGNYIFNAANVPGGILPNANYEIRIQLNQPNLSPNLVPTQANGATTSVVNDSNGVNAGAYVSTTLTTGGPGANNHTYDFGFMPVTPTAVEMISLSATADATSVALRWRTGVEETTTSFTIFRATTNHRAAAVQVSATPLAAQGDYSAYSWVDRDVVLGQEYFYWVQALSATGETDDYGPASTLVPLASDGSTLFLPFVSR